MELVAKAKHCEDLAEQSDQDQVEKQEDTQVVDDVCDHYDNWSEDGENPQEEECLGDEKQHNHAHQYFGSDVEWPKEKL